MNKSKSGIIKEFPKPLYEKILRINKLISDTVMSLSKENKYKNIDKKVLEKFVKLPNETNVPSVMVYQKKKIYSCMIQVTNHIESSIELRKFISDVYNKINKKIRKEFKFELSSEYDKEKKYEGFDIWTGSKLAKEIWNIIKGEEIEYKESYDVLIVESKNLPKGLQELISEVSNNISSNFDQFKEKYDIFKNVNILDEFNGYTVIKKINESYEGFITLTSQFENVDYELINMKNKAFDNIIDFNESFDDKHPTKYLSLSENDERHFEILLDNEYSKKLYEYFNNKSLDIQDKEEVIIESKFNGKQKEAENMLASISRDLTNRKPNQHTMNLISNIFNKNVMPYLKTPYNRIQITCDSKREGIVEFKIPKLGKETIFRLIDGKESFTGFIHRESTIHISISDDIFRTIEKSDQLYPFIKRLINYYDKDLEKHGNYFIKSLMSLDKESRYLLSTSLHSLVDLGIQILLIFDEVQVPDTKLFKHEGDNIKEVFNFIKMIFKKYNEPEKEKKKILNDLKYLMNELIANSVHIKSIHESVEKFYNNEYVKDVNQFVESWIESNIDREWQYNQQKSDVKLLTEKFGVKKLKKIPNDLVAYITIETECIRDANDKMMLVSYTLGKIELIEWYIELIDVGSKKYIVPQDKKTLQRIRLQLIECYKNIMKVDVSNRKEKENNNPWPKGYEG